MTTDSKVKEKPTKKLGEKPLSKLQHLSKHQFEERVQQLLKEHKNSPTKGIYY